MPVWLGPEVWWADRFWFEIGSQLFSSSFVLGFYGVLSVDQRLWGGGSCLIIRIIVQLIGYIWSVSFRGGYFGLSGGDGWSWISFFSGGFMKESVFRWWCLFWWVLSSRVWLGVLCAGVFMVFIFWMFRLCTAPFVCILCFIDLCSSWAGIWFLIIFAD